MTKYYGIYRNMRSKEFKVYQAWKNMKTRCFNKNFPRYSDYGGRGVTVCDEWLNFETFKADMYSSFKFGLMLDRIDNNGNYCKENCRWVNSLVSNNNTRRNRYLTYDMRIRTYNWPIEIAFERRVQ